MQRSLTWLKANAHWLAKARPLWVAFGFVLLVCVLSLLVPRTLNDRIRYCGWVLELSGISIVIVGLNEKLRLFNRPSLVGHVGNWLAERPQFSPRSRTVPLTGESMTLTGGFATLSVWSNPVDGSVEARIGALESNVKSLKEMQGNTAKQIEEQKTMQDQALTAEREARKTAVQEVRATMETFGIGGLHMEAIGVFWLMLGATFATMSPEISTVLKAILGA
jgi:hypothetical protein